MTATVRSVLWVDETHLPGWPPPGPDDGMTVRAVRAAFSARDAVRRMRTALASAPEATDDEFSGGDAA